MPEFEAANAIRESNLDPILVADSNAHAIERLYAQHHLAIYRYLRSRGHSDADAADLVAVAFERALRALPRYRPQGSPISWLLRIARNAAIDAARRRRRLTSWGDTTGKRTPVDDHSPEAEYLARERASELILLVQSLPEPQRDAIALRYSAGLTAREIGLVIGKSEAATQKLLTRALDALKEAIDDRS